jgi:hypothetical protein
LLYGLIEGSSNGWTIVPIALIGAAAILFAGFCRRQVTAAQPLLKPALLANKGFTSGLVTGLVFFAALSGLNYVISLFLQGGLHYPPAAGTRTTRESATTGHLTAAPPDGRMASAQGIHQARLELPAPAAADPWPTAVGRSRPPSLGVSVPFRRAAVLAGVSRRPSRRRCSNGVPTICSSRRICWLRVGWAMNIRSAARVKLPASATVAK